MRLPEWTLNREATRTHKSAKDAFVFDVKALPVYARNTVSAAGEAALARFYSAHPLCCQILPCLFTTPWNDYLRADGSFPSVALGICVTRAPPPTPAPSVPVLASGRSGVKPTALRTSASIFAVVSLFSLRYARTFSRPCPIRSVL